ncbi:type I-E CRISPR-associated protein Cse2/CasB [Streptomyces sp. NPDC002073]
MTRNTASARRADSGQATASASDRRGIPRSYSLPRQVAIRTVARLYAGYRDDTPSAVASVARLRRAAGTGPYTSTESWGLDHLEALVEAREQERIEAERLPPIASSATVQNTSTAWNRSRRQEEREDAAVHLAVTLWALHQQAIRGDSMHAPGWTLGRAARRLAHGKTGIADHPPTAPGGSDAVSESTGGATDEGTTRGYDPVEQVSETVRKRFVRIGASTDTEVLAGRLRELILLLRNSRIPLDYGLLAEQLCQWQDQNRQDEVRHTWGRDFHRVYRQQQHGKSPSYEEDSTADTGQGSADFTDEESAD